MVTFVRCRAATIFFMIWLGFHQRPGSPFCFYRRGDQRSERLNSNSCCWTRCLPARRRLCAASILMALSLTCPASAQESRKLKSGNQPEYPGIAKRYKIQGTARLLIVVAPDGSVKEVKVLGGNAVLAQAAVDAVKKWKYEPAPAESTLVLKFDFKP